MKEIAMHFGNNETMLLLCRSNLTPKHKTNFRAAWVIKASIIIILAVVCSHTMSAQSYDSLASRAHSLYMAKEYKNSLEVFEQAFSISQKNPNDLYDGACSAALAGETKKALACLSLAFENGWLNLQHTRRDSDLLSLHHEKEWMVLLQKMQIKIDEIDARIDKPLRAELLRMYEDDQKYRLMVDSVQKNYGAQSPQMKNHWRFIAEIDSINTAKVKVILARYGWVGSDRVGEDGNRAIFAVIQHSDSLTQETYLPMMRAAVKKGNASASSLAFLEDRVALHEGRKQIYGSQIGRVPETGEYFIQALADPDNVDKRRAEVGLGKLADYAKQWNIQWDADAYKKKENLHIKP
jgi:hypothetical protein